MSHKRVFFSIIVMLSLCLSGALVIAQASPLPRTEEARADTLPGYANFARIDVHNNDIAALPSGYTVSFTLDTVALIAGLQMQADCDDLRISFTDISEVELHRLVTGCNTAATVVQFRTQAAIGIGLSDTRYSLNYNNPAAGTPPQNPANVYAFYDDFQDGDAAGWTVTKGTWGVYNDSGNYVYRYSSGGGNWPLAYASVPASDVDYLAKLRASASTNWIGLAFRIQNSTNFLSFYESKDVSQFKYARIVNDNHNVVLSPGFAMSAGAWYWVRLQAVGTMVRARIWADGSAEPGTWLISTTDTTFQTGTNIGLTLYYHNTSADWDNIQVRRLAAAEPTVAVRAWWENAWEYRRPVTVTNTSTSASLPTRYTASFTLDTAALISTGRMRTDCSDLRLAYDPTGLAPVQIDLVVEKCNNTQTIVWFALQRPVAPSGVETAYTLYYGNASAGTPPANGMNVFLFFEDWEQGTTHWTNAGGLDPGNTGRMGNSQASTDQSFSPSTSQRYTTKASGGDAFSGYIPVTPSTSYTVNLWGYSTSSTTSTPVGFDPYTSGYVKGTETWFWYNDAWPIGGTWGSRFYNFATASDTAYIKIKSELWDNPSFPGTGPVYLDNISLRYYISSAPTVVLGPEDLRMLVLAISNIVEVTDPVAVGSPIQISADVTAAVGSVSSVTLKILSPQTVDVPMTNISGNTWQASFTPNQGGTYTYQIYATGSTGATRSSPQYTFTSTDTVQPVVSLVSITDPIYVGFTQTLTVLATDNGLVSAVTVTVDGATHPMTAIGGNQYRYSWTVPTSGTIPYTVTATDTSGNAGTYNGSFVSQPQLTISNIVEVTDPVTVGNPIQISADVTAALGSVSTVTLRILTPQTVDVPMANISGNTWQGSITPNQGGTYTYQIYATGSTGATASSPQYTFVSSDTINPSVLLVSITDPIFVNNTQTLTVQATDNGLLRSVTVLVNGATYPMAAIGGNQYRYSWQVPTPGTIPYTVTATDTVGRTGTISGSFVSQPRLADVCNWKGCRPGAASWSVDDTSSACFAELNAAGIKGTYYGTGTVTQSWWATYAAAGHEIGSHTVGHPCNTPSCTPTCTYDSLMAIPVDPAVVTVYRTGQVEPNILAIEAGTHQPVLSLAWPCGCTDPSRMQAAASSVLGSRGYYDYIAQLTWVEDVNTITPKNFQLLNTAASYRQELVDRAISEGKWSITTSHGSCAGIDYLGQQNTAGTLWVAPVGDVLKYINVRNASQLSNYSRSGNTISYDMVHTLSSFQPTNLTLLPILYNNLVTLRALLEDGDVVQGVTVDGNPVTYTLVTINSVPYVTFDAALNTSRHVIITLAPGAPFITNVSVTPNPVELGGAVTFSATVVAASGTSVQTVTLNVLSPEVQNLTMTLYAGDEYRVSFTPAQLGSYSYRVTATNNLGNPRHSMPTAFTVQDTTPPSYQIQSQTSALIANGGSNTLSAETSDLGNVVRAVLSTNENGDWQDFDWPVSDWWNYSWAHRRLVTITEAAGLARTNELVDLSISSVDFTGLTSCVNELRVINQSGVEIPSQVYGEQVDGGGVRTCHLVFQASPAANRNQTYKIYYGNPSAIAPSYTSDLSGSTSTNLRTVQSSYFDLDINSTLGIISRMRLPLGSNTNLPLSPSSDMYSGWHQVCSYNHGNITGINAQCRGSAPPATGLNLAETVSGPLLREYAFTSVKDGATFTVTFRFFAGTPYYRYTVTRSGATASAVMNNFWYTNGFWARLGFGTGGTPSRQYNTYDYTTDHFRMVSLTTVDVVGIDGDNNDGTDLGGTNYMTPTAVALDLVVAAGASSSAIDDVLVRFNAPLGSAVGAEENRPLGLYGSPIEMTPTAGWVSTSFLWQNPAITDTVVEWRIKYCDASSNCRYTAAMYFGIGTPTAVSLSYFNGKARQKTIQLDWETASEVKLLGFNLYRSESLDGLRQKQNTHLIQARKPGQLVGAGYQFSDLVSPGRRYYYWLEWVGVDGAEVAGPLVVNSDFLIHLPLTHH